VSVVGYPTPGKAKAREILGAFCAGARGQVLDTLPMSLLPGAAAFYGVTPATKAFWEQAKAEGRDWYYIDNAYFHEWRGTYYRATKNRLQHTGIGTSDGKRFAALDLEILPWRKPGKHVVVAPQSDEFMQVVAQWGTNLYGQTRWVDAAIAAMYQETQREVRVLTWNRDKTKWYSELPANLVDCWSLLTYSSASAISALLAGIPAICTADDCIAAPMVKPDFDDIEYPLRPEGREAWAGVVADNQWTLDEMRSGLAWRMLHA
jgi:hypothetical protein